MHRRLLFPLLILMPWPAFAANPPAHPAPAAAVAPDTEPDPTSPDEVFAQMKHSFRPDRAKGQHLKYQFDFSDPQGGKYWVEIDNGSCKIGTGTIDRPDVTFYCTGADWVQLSNGTLGGFQAFFTGRLKISGNQFTAHRLDAMFP